MKILIVTVSRKLLLAIQLIAAQSPAAVNHSVKAIPSAAENIPVAKRKQQFA